MLTPSSPTVRGFHNIAFETVSMLFVHSFNVRLINDGPFSTPSKEDLFQLLFDHRTIRDGEESPGRPPRAPEL